MKSLLILGFAILVIAATSHADSNTPADDTIWSRSWAEGGGASDSCYYFLGRKGEMTRVRILYVAAYDNGASGTDYFLEGGSLRVDKIKGDKKLAEEQVKGRDSGITVVSTYTLQTSGAQEALISSTGNEMSYGMCCRGGRLPHSTVVQRKTLAITSSDAVTTPIFTTSDTSAWLSVCRILRSGVTYVMTSFTF